VTAFFRGVARAVGVYSPCVAFAAVFAGKAWWRAVGVVVPGVTVRLAALELTVARRAVRTIAAVLQGVARTVQVERERIFITPEVAASRQGIALAVHVGLVGVTRAALSGLVTAVMEVDLALDQCVQSIGSRLETTKIVVEGLLVKQ